MNEKKRVVEALLLVMRTAKVLEDTLNSIMPAPNVRDVGELLFKKITTLQAKPSENMENVIKTLKEDGFGEIIEKLSGIREKTLLGFLYYYGSDGEAVYRAFEETTKLPECSRFIVEDFSTDSLTVNYLLEKYRPTRVLAATLRRRGREPGLYSYKVFLEPPKPEEAGVLVIASLDGSLEVEHLLDGLRVFHPNVTIEVVECDPGSGSAEYCYEKLKEFAREEYNRLCGVGAKQ